MEGTLERDGTMQSNIVHRFAAALETAGHELRARMMLSVTTTNAHPTGLWAAAPAPDARTTERSTRTIRATDSGIERCGAAAR